MRNLKNESSAGALDDTLTYRPMAQRSLEDLNADWSSKLEAVLHDPEVEEAIREVSE